MTCADVRLGLTWQSVKQVWRVGRVKARVGAWGLLDWRVSERDGAWRRVERVLVR